MTQKSKQHTSADDLFRRKVKVAEILARNHAMTETIEFHAKCIEKILRKQMPKGWSLRFKMALLNNREEEVAAVEKLKTDGVCHTFDFLATFLLQELIDQSLSPHE